MNPVFDLPRRLCAEFTGTMLLLATVVGSGIMAETLATDNGALALLGNTLPTGAILVVLILIFGPVSGAHFNPAVTFAFLLRRQIKAAVAVAYVLIQITGAVTGVILAHAMFDQTLLQTSATVRFGAGQWLSEGIATFGLVAAILGTVRFRPDAVAYAVGLFITAGYWFTASTSFANPAVTLARALTDSYSGILAAHVPAFILAQFIGAAVATGLFAWLLKGVGTGGSVRTPDATPDTHS